MKTKYFILSLLCAATASVNAMENNQHKRKLSVDDAMDVDYQEERTVKQRTENTIDYEFLAEHNDYLTLRGHLTHWKAIVNYQMKSSDIAAILNMNPAEIPTLGYNNNKMKLIDRESQIIETYRQMTGCLLEFKDILNIAAQLKWI